MTGDIYTEWVKFWGGLAGLATGAFTIWDRILRSRPWMEPHVVPSMKRPFLDTLSIDAPIFLRIHNPGRYAIGVGTLRLRGAKTERLEFEGDVGRDVHPSRLIPIAAGEHRLFPLIWTNPEGEDNERPFWITVSWRPLRGLMPRPPLFLRTSLAALTRLQEDELRVYREERERGS